MSQMPKVAPPFATGNPICVSDPGSLVHGQEPGSGYGIGFAMGGFDGGAMRPNSAGGAPGSAYDSPFAHPPVNGSAYHGQNPSMIYGMGGPMGSRYGMSVPMGSMYGMGVPMGSMYGMGGPMTSMYGMGGGGYSIGGFSGSLYGGSLADATGSLYGTGGLLYGSNRPEAVMGSIYGSHMGSIFGGFNSVYQVDGPHTGLGVVRKQSIPNFSYSFRSNLGSVMYHRSLNTDWASKSSGARRVRGNSFRTSTSMAAIEVEVKPKVKDENEGTQQRGTSDVRRDGRVLAENAKGDTPSAVDKMADKSKSTKKDKPVTEAPKTPTTAREQRNGDAAGQVVVLSSDFRIHNVAIVEQVGDGGGVTVTKKGEACVVNGKSYPMDEVVVYTPANKEAVVESRHLQDLIEHVLAGHNTAILVDDDGKAKAAAQAAVQDTMMKLMGEIKKPARNSYAGLSMSMCSLPSKTTARDLLDSNAKAVSLRVGSSPLFGPIVMGLKSETIESGAHFATLYDAALRRGEEESMMVCVVVVRQMRPASDEGKGGVFLSSVFIGVSRAGPRAFHEIIDKSPASAQEVFRYAIDGPTVCVHIVAVRQDTPDEGVLGAAAKIGAVQNSAARSGNVRRFIDFTEDQLKGMLKRRDTSTGPEKAELDHHVRRLNLVLQDAKKLFADPKSTEPNVYQMEVGKSTQTTPAAMNPHLVSETAVGKEARGESAAAADDRPRSTNVATLVIAEAAESRAYSVEGTTVTAGGRPFVVDEVVLADTVKPTAMETQTTGQVLAAFLKGYNGALIVVDSAAVAANGMESPAMGFVFSAVADALENPGCKGVRVSIALLRVSGVACDLVSSATELKPVKVSSSPLFGPMLHNAALHPIDSKAKLQRIVDEAREHVRALWDSHSAVHVTVVHCFANGDDVYVSSLLVSLASAACSMYEQVLQRKAHNVHDLFRYAFGGAATTTYVVSVGKADQVTDVVASLGTQRAASIVHNRAPRQGSIKNFISYTNSLLDKRRERLAGLPDDSAEKTNMIKFIAPMERMLSDHEKAMADPTNNFPQAYAAENDSDKKAQGEGSAAAGAVAQEGSKLLTGDGSRDSPSDLQARQSPQNANDATTSSTRPDNLSLVFTEPRVVAFVGFEVAAGAKRLSLGDQEYMVDEVVRRVTSSGGITTGQSASVGEVAMRFAEVHNCSLISASSMADAPSAEEPVWAYFQQFLNNALAGGKPGEEVFVDLEFSVVSADELIADLLLDEDRAEPKHLEIASSPICGPHVHNSSSVSVHSAEEVARVMDKVHTRAEHHLVALRTGDLMMVGTALQRRRTNENDVLVASLMGTLTGPSVKAYREAIEKAPGARRLLLGSAYGGPSATITVVNVGAEDELAQGMITTAVSISKKQRNLVSRTGSVRAFVRYTESTMKREQARAAAALGDAKERYLQRVNRLHPVVEDHKKLLQDFTMHIPAYMVGRPNSGTVPKVESEDTQGPDASMKMSQHEQQTEMERATPAVGHASKEPAAVNRIQTVVVVTANGKTHSSTVTVPVAHVDEAHITIPIAGEQRTIEFDEVMRRKDHASAVCSEKLSAVVQHFVKGFNTALLCCDVAGSNAGPTACAEVVHNVIDRKPEKSELYFSIAAVSDGSAVKDLLALSGGSGYASMKVSNSLIFGPWFHEATMVRLAGVAQFDDVFSAAYAEATTDGALCVISVVLKTMEREDVIVSSLLMSLSTQLNAHAVVVNALPETDRKLYQFAVHGSCFTVGLLGLLDKVDGTGLEECIGVYAQMRTIENPPLRNGSVRRFLTYSITAAADARSRAKRATDERQRPSYEQRLALLEKMVVDARELIESPEGRIPKTYM
ncbi:hypothetical protein JKF63_02322 [Porcisia hertigi]|uniref:Uncharacterized protein n=1 Tax=Porcisia hertigi TaxID=2761500 RepID=A0A836H7U1_9TRYP|nr:hypothetical protein JKF63_02322 [Porcisia hertigi]